MDKTNKMFRDLLFLIRTLRGDGGCPWDRKQTMETLKAYLQQEFQELMGALDGKASEKIQEEMGDLIFLLLFTAEIARDQGDFSIEDVLENIKEKMIRRHPHVFGDLKADDISEIRKNWKKIKAEEIRLSSKQSLMERIPRYLPPLLQAYWATRRASQAGLDWKSPVDLVDKMEQEMAEFREALAYDDQAMARRKLGNLFFTLINLSRLLKINPETVVKESLRRFIQRFKYIEENLRQQKKSLREASMEERERLWEEAKGEENHKCKM